MKNNHIYAGILIIIPFIVLVYPWYNFSDPYLLGLPFFYWFQTVMLVVSAIFFVIAAYFIDKEEVKA